MLLADMGLPMLALYWPVAWVALIPIIYLEGKIGSKMLGEPVGSCCRASMNANAVSTLVGIPVTWVLLTVIEMYDGGGRAFGLDTFPKVLYAVTVQAPWLNSYQRNMVWMIPAATIVLSVFFYLMSVGVEFLIVRWHFRSHSKRKLLHWMIIANAWSYGLMILMTILWAVAGAMF